MTSLFKNYLIVQQRYISWVSGTLTVLLICNVEMIWVAIYHNLPGGDAAEMARGVSKALFMVRLPAELAIPLGIAVEAGLAILFGATIYFAVSLLPRRKASTASRSAITVGLLAFIWTTNIYVALPLINPAVDATIPHALSLAFYVFFGSIAAVAIKLLDTGRQDRAITRAVVEALTAGKPMPGTVTVN